MRTGVLQADMEASINPHWLQICHEFVVLAPKPPSTVLEGPAIFDVIGNGWLNLGEPRKTQVELIDHAGLPVAVPASST
jgi:hypothetical protein